MLIREVTLDRSNRRADKSVSLTFTTNLEQSSTEFMEIDKLDKSAGVLVFKPSGRLTEQEVQEIEKIQIEVNGKTHRERLRNVLFVAWEQSESEKDFNTFYADYYETQIQKIKDTLI